MCDRVAKKEAANNMFRIGNCQWFGNLTRREEAAPIFRSGKASSESVGVQCLSTISVKKIRPGVLLFILIVSALGGCNEEPKARREYRQTSAYSTELLEFDLGTIRLRVPWNVLSHAPNHGYEFIGKGPFKVDEIDIMVRWPEMTGRAEVAGAHDAFHIRISSYIEPPASVLKANGEFNFGFPDDYLVGPYPSKATGIEEWRTKDRGRPVLFAVQDPTNRTKMGVDRPTVICSDPNPPEIFTCSGGGRVPSSFRYSYTLYPPIVTEWPDIHVAVRKLILSMMVKEN